MEADEGRALLKTFPSLGGVQLALFPSHFLAFLRGSYK